MGKVLKWGSWVQEMCVDKINGFTIYTLKPLALVLVCLCVCVYYCKSPRTKVLWKKLFVKDLSLWSDCMVAQG